MSDLIHVRAECRTTDGRKVGLVTPVDVFLFQDEPVMRDFVLHTLRRTAAEGDPAGELAEDTLLIEQLRPLPGLEHLA